MSKVWRAWVSGALLVALATFAAAQQAERPPRKAAKEKSAGEDWQSATMPAPALAFGAELEREAAPEFKVWALAQSKKLNESLRPDHQDTIAAMDRRYPDAPAEARDAGLFLVFYLAYKDADTYQQIVAARIQEIDRQVRYAQRDLQLLRDGMGSLTQTTPVDLSRRADTQFEENRLIHFLHALGEHRRANSAELAAAGKNVDAFLELLGAAHEEMKEIQAKVIRQLN